MTGVGVVRFGCDEERERDGLEVDCWVGREGEVETKAAERHGCGLGLCVC